MTLRHICQCGFLSSLLLGISSPAIAQTDNACESFLNVTRSLTSISTSDQQQISACIQAKVDELANAAASQRAAAFKTFRAFVNGEYQNPRSTPQFKQQVVQQTVQLASPLFKAPNARALVTQALAQVLVDFKDVGTYPGLLAGLQSNRQIVRYHCAKAMAALKPQFASDKAKLTEAVAALQAAGVAETNGVVLRRIYMALAYEGDLVAVFDAYLAILDKRIDARRNGAAIAEMAEVAAWEFFRRPAVLSSMNQSMKAAFVSRLAVVFRLDAERYAATGQSTEELDALERRLEGEEALLEAIVGGTSGSVRAALASTGRADRAKIAEAAYGWVGHAERNITGPVNKGPWNVPAGAP